MAKPPPKKLHTLLIDGSQLVYRAHYALPPMARADGVPTGTVFGFTKSLLTLLRNPPALHGPISHAAVIFDGPGKTFRHEIFPRYKSGRLKRRPAGLVKAMPLVRQAAEACGVRALTSGAGAEADDLLATCGQRSDGVHLWGRG